MEKWFPHVTFEVPIETFHELPRNPAYKYEYWDGHVHLSARAKYYHCLLELTERGDIPDVIECQGDAVRIRPLEEEDWPNLPSLFAVAFHRMPPFALIPRDDRPIAAAECLDEVRYQRNGPLVESASFVAYRVGDEKLVGCQLITLAQAGDLESFRDRLWAEHPPEDAIAQRWGRPHLTWLFVAPFQSRYGVGSAMLSRGINELLTLGYKELASTFLLGNDSSTLWHWKQGFRLLDYPGTMRNIDRQIERDRQEQRENGAGDGVE